jgi:VWFA-related protein
VATRVRPERVRRTIALVVDDLGLSFRSTIEVREALEAFVDRQMEPGDLVAIIRTRGGIGALQQFTADKAQLYAAIERVRFNAAQNRVGVDSFAPIGEDKNLIDANEGPRGTAGKSFGASIEGLRQSTLAEASLESVRFVVRGLASLPGRKGVVVFSEGLKLYEAERSPLRSDPRAGDALQRLIDEANRASVVLYTVDTRGLTTQSLGAYDDVNTALGTRDVGAADFQGHLAARRELQRETEWGLQALAQETGGFLLRNQNDLSKSVERVLEDQRGYYLIGYAPDPSTFKDDDGKRSFHRIRLSTKRPGLKVRSRAGFYGVLDVGSPDAPPAAAPTLADALASPFASGDIRIELASLFVEGPKGGYVLRSLIHLDTRGLELREIEGRVGTRLELLAVTFGDNGTVVDQLGRSQELRVAADQLERAHREGVTFRLDVPVRKPGAYQLRVAVRDTHSGRTGSANQLVHVPDLGRKELTLSGIVLGSVQPDGTPTEAGTDATAALRRFRPGQALSYSFAVYNAKRDGTGRPQLGAQMRLFRDDKLVTLGEARALEPGATSNPRQVTGGGAFVLGPEMPPGDYVLQVIVTDAVASRKKATIASQAVAFEVNP